MDVDVVAAGTAAYPPGAVYGPRSLREHELVWLDAGSAVWTRAATRLELRAGDVLLVPPGAPDTFTWDPRRRTIHGYAHLLPHPAPAADPVHVPAGADELLLATCGQAAALLDRTDAVASARLRLLLSLAVGLALAGTHRAGADPVLPDVLRRVASGVGRRWSRDGPVALSLDDLAAGGAVSRRHLCRLAEARLGVGLVHALEVLRLSRVAVLLARSTLTVAAAGRACGYGDPFHLSRHFRDVYGLPPTAYRAAAAAGRPVPDPVTDAGLAEFARLVRVAESAGQREPAGG